MLDYTGADALMISWRSLGKTLDLLENPALTRYGGTANAAARQGKAFVDIACQEIAQLLWSDKGLHIARKHALIFTGACSR